jgi:hypothetical protein
MGFWELCQELWVLVLQLLASEGLCCGFSFVVACSEGNLLGLSHLKGEPFLAL